MDAPLTDYETQKQIIGQLRLNFDESAASTKARNLEFHFRSPMTSQNLAWRQRHARLQVTLDLLRIGIDQKTIVFSDEVCFLNG